MATILERLEQPLLRLAGRLGQQPHLNAIRDGVVGALPLVLIGSLFLLIAQPPLPSVHAIDAYGKLTINGVPLVPQLLVVFRVLVGLIGLYVAFGVAHSLARRYDLDALSAGLLAAAALFLMNGVQVAPLAGKTVKVIPIDYLGASGLFMAIIIGLLVPEVQRLARRHKLEIRMPAGVPAAVSRSFSALIPGLLVLVPIWIVVYLLGVDLFKIITEYLARPIQHLSASERGDGLFTMPVFWIMTAIIVIDSLLWLLGVHAVAILAPLSAVWLANITANSVAAATGMPATNFNTRETLQFFVWLGGSGATLVLPFLLWRARSAGLRAIARVGVVPALFNINEPLIFGVPVMMNVTLMVPFILAPLVNLTIAALAVQLGLVPMPTLIVPWTLPAPIGAYLATGGAWQAAVLSLVNIAVSCAIYLPFVRALDRRVAATEAAAAPAPAP